VPIHFQTASRPALVSQPYGYAHWADHRRYGQQNYLRAGDPAEPAPAAAPPAVLPAMPRWQAAAPVHAGGLRGAAELRQRQPQLHGPPHAYLRKQVGQAKVASVIYKFKRRGRQLREGSQGAFSGAWAVRLQHYRHPSCCPWGLALLQGLAIMTSEESPQQSYRNSWGVRLPQMQRGPVQMSWGVRAACLRRS
jgi:hypothetical protein